MKGSRVKDKKTLVGCCVDGGGGLWVVEREEGTTEN